MNWKTLVPVTLPVKVPHSAAGNKNSMKSARNPIACDSTHHHQDSGMHCLATVNLPSRHEANGRLLSMHVVPGCWRCAYKKAACNTGTKAHSF